MRSLVAPLFAAWLIAVGAHAAPPPYQIRQLGMLDGVTSARPLDINNHGEIVGLAYYGERYSRACYWNSSGEMIDLGLGTSGTQCVARKINNLGKIIGDDDWGANAVLWDGPNSTPVPLGPDVSSTIDINDSGQIVGGQVVDGSLVGTVVRDMDAEIHRLGIPQYWGISAINELGVMAGYTTYPYRAYTCGIDGVPAWLQGDDAMAFDVNDTRQSAGRARNPDGLYRAVMWDASGDVTWLEPVEGVYHSFARAINNAATIVGYSTTPGSRACLWTAWGDLIDLGALAGGYGSEAYAINDHGWAVGVYFDGAAQYPVLWTPVPEPPSLMVVFGGLTCAGVFQRRRRYTNQSRAGRE